MRGIVLYVITLFIVYGCDHSRWETIAGNGIDDEPKSIDNVIYFENERNGIVGGFTLIDDPNAQNDVRLSPIPTGYLTSDGGKNWKQIYFDPAIKQILRNAYLSHDTLICETDSLVLFSTDKGQSFEVLTVSSDRFRIISQYLKTNKSPIRQDHFQYKGTEYSIKERYTNDRVSVIVCHGPGTLTDYYFVSFDQEKSWTFLQSDFGDNRQRFLLEDKFLLCYQFPFGLQRLPLKY
jgi:hypothetical protein